MSDSATSGDSRAPAAAFGRARERAYEAVTADSTPVDERIRRLLEVGRSFLGVENGHVERARDDGTNEVVESANGDARVVAAGEIFDRATTYCRRTLARESALAVSDAAEQGWADDPARDERGLSCYLGAPVSVDGERWGTVCFVSRDPRPREFDQTERAFVELAARMVGRLTEARRHAEEVTAHREARARAAAKYESLFAAAPDAVVVAEAESRRVVEANEAATDLTGHARGELIGRRVETLCPPEARERYVDAFEALLDDEPAGRDSLADGSQLVLCRADGTRVPVAVSADVVELGGEPHVHAVVRDLTDRERRARLIDVLDRVLRHNLRNDMGLVGGTARTLADGLDATEAAQAERIGRVADDLVSLADEARTLRSVLGDDRDARPTDVVPTVVDAAARLRESAPHATVVVDAPPTARARAPARLDAALDALAENAAEHAGASPRVVLTVERAGDEVVVAVTDDGAGIPDSERRVLEGGEETQLDHGSGLGTWLVNWVVTAADGAVETTVDGEGSTVTMRFPAAE